MGDENNDCVTFKCSFPQIQSAIKLDGAGGARIQLDIPESEMPNFLPMIAWRGQLIQIIACLESKGFAEQKQDDRPRRNQRYPYKTA